MAEENTSPNATAKAKPSDEPNITTRAQASSNSTKSTKSSKERKRRHTIKDVMANHAMEVIGGILGLPSRDLADEETAKSSKSKSFRQRRHTMESHPSSRYSSFGNRSRRSSKDSGRPLSGAEKYDLDTVAGVSIKKRRGSVKKNMLNNTKEAVTNAVEGVKSLLAPPQVSPEVSSAVVESAVSNAVEGVHSLSTTPKLVPEPEAQPQDGTAPPLITESVHITAATKETDQKGSSESLASLAHPKESIAEAVPVERS